MTPRDDLVAETREWIDKARSDSQACDALIAANLPAQALFHAQQCVEKVLKAVLVWHQTEFGRTHDLDELKHRCLPFLPGAADDMAGIERLSQYAWRFRYPGAPYDPDQGEAEVASRAAGHLLHTIAQILEREISA